MARNISGEQLRDTITTGRLPEEVMVLIDRGIGAATLRTDILYAASDLSRTEPPVEVNGEIVRLPLDLALLAQTRPAVAEVIAGMAT